MVMRLLFTLALSVSITACGFHLRGQLPIHESLKVIAVQSTDRDLQRSLEESLQVSGATIVSNPADALAVLNLHTVNFERQVLTIDDRGKVTGYILQYKVAYTVTGAEGANLKTANLTERRDFNFDPDLVLQKEIEENALREDMVTQLTQRILRQLTTITAMLPAQHQLAFDSTPVSLRRGG